MKSIPVLLLECDALLMSLPSSPCLENASERTAGAAEGRGHAAGQPLRHGHDPRLCREGRLTLAAAHAQDGRSPQTCQRLGRLLQDFRAGWERGSAPRVLVTDCAGL